MLSLQTALYSTMGLSFCISTRQFVSRKHQYNTAPHPLSNHCHPTTTLLELINLATPCHRNISLQVAAATSISIAGPSGCGKSLLLRAIADLDPHEGEVRLAGVAQSEMPAEQWRAKVGLLPADYYFWGETVADSMPNGAKLDALNLHANTLQKPINLLSSGEKQRLALIRLTMQQPQCLLLDEPTAHLDPQTTRLAEALIADYQRRQGCPIIWVSHNKAQRQRVADRHYQISEGGLVEVTLEMAAVLSEALP